MNLTTRQQEVLDFIKAKVLERGYGPTVREICDEFHFSSPNGARCHLNYLVEKGAITREPHSSRGLSVVGGLGEGIPFFPDLAALTRALRA